METLLLIGYKLSVLLLFFLQLQITRPTCLSILLGDHLLHLRRPSPNFNSWSVFFLKFASEDFTCLVSRNTTWGKLIVSNFRKWIKLEADPSLEIKLSIKKKQLRLQDYGISFAHFAEIASPTWVSVSRLQYLRKPYYSLIKRLFVKQ